MLGPDGKLRGVLTLLNWGGGCFWIMDSYYLREWHLRWFEDNMMPGVTLRDISNGAGGFLLTGPRARNILHIVTDHDLAGLPLLSCAMMDLGLLRTRMARMSITGEMGYEINCGGLEHATLRRILLEAGKAHGLAEFGFGGGNSLRLEKSFGISSHEYRQGHTPGETGLDRFIVWTKTGFIGEAKARTERDGKPSKRILVTLEIEAGNADANGYEPVWRKGGLVGYVTSGNYGHTLKRSLALAMIERDVAAVGTALTTHIVGDECRAVVIAAWPYDPSSSAMRG